MISQFENASLVSLSAALPERKVTSLELERELLPTYSRIGLVTGRLELMTGIEERGFFDRDRRPSEISVAASLPMFERYPELREKIDCVIHASVCRDLIEPATAAFVHRSLGLPRGAILFDLSTACLGWLTGIEMAANLVEKGNMRNVLVVSGENSCPVVEQTIARLNSDPNASRDDVKRNFATLTLGSAGIAAIIGTGNGARIKSSAFRSATEWSSLCRGTEKGMETQSDRLLSEGVALASETWRDLRRAGSVPAKFFSHQVGRSHRELMLRQLDIESDQEFSVFRKWGNMGASSIGVSVFLGATEKKVSPNETIGLLGIGSGLVCGMMTLNWAEGVVC